MEVQGKSTSKARLEFVTLSQEMMSAYAKDKGIKGECERCGYAQWEIALDGEADLGGVAALEVRTHGVKGHVPCYVLVCENCGNLWLLAARTFLDWANGRKEAEK